MTGISLTLAFAIATPALPGAAMQTGTAPPASTPPKLMEPPRLAPTIIPGARQNYLREVEEAQRKALGAEAGAEALPEAEAQPELEPQPEPPAPAAGPSKLATAPSVVANPATAPVPATAPAPAASALPAPLKLVFSLLGALAMLVGPSIAAMWLIGHFPTRMGD